MIQELAHRFGSFLTSAAGNPFGMLGRALAHWGVFFDADFSTLDGNDWVDNGDGTFTLHKSYIDEWAFKRTTDPGIYNDLDLYTMGLLDPNQVKSSFVIENPTLQDGRRLRMHSSGNLVEIQASDGTWSGPFYLPSDIVIRGTRREITLQDIIDLEGPRDPAPALSQKDFNVAFINLTNEEESYLDTLEHTQKLNRFKDSFTRFFQDMSRNLGNLLFPQGQTLSAQGVSGGVGATSGIASALSGSPPRNDLSTGTVIASPLSSLRGGLQADEAISELGVLLYSHPFGDSGIEPFEPLDLTSLKPVDFNARLTRLLPESYSLDTLKNSFVQAALGPLFLPSSLRASRSEAKQSPSLSTFQLSALPVNLMTETFEANLFKDIQKPVLLSELRDQSLTSLREAFPDPTQSPSPLLDALSPQEAMPSPSFTGRSPTPQEASPSPQSPSPRLAAPPLATTAPATNPGRPAEHFGGQSPKSPSHTPLIWDALASKRAGQAGETTPKKRRPLSFPQKKQKKGVSSPFTPPS